MKEPAIWTPILRMAAISAIVSIVSIGAISTVAAEPDKLLFENLPALDVPAADPDVLAQGHSFRLVDGGLNFLSVGNANDSDDEDDVSFYSLSANTRYFLSLERRQSGYSVLVHAGDALARAPATEGSEYNNDLYLEVLPEGRSYPDPKGPFFLYAAGEFDLNVQTSKITGAFASDANSFATGRIGLAVGAGFGRVLAIDPVVRLRRLERALQREGLLAGPIPDNVGSDIIRTWYALRNHVGNYPRLAYSMKHLSEAGLLTGEPNLRATYKAIAILQDPFIFNRLRGAQARLGVGVVKPFIGFDSAESADASMAILGSGQYERPLSTVRQISVRGQLFVDLGDVELDNREWSLRGSVSDTRAFYTPTYDPTGSLTLSAELGISGRRTIATNGPSAGIDAIGRAIYSRVLNGGSMATFGGNLSLRNDGEFVLGFSVGLTRGIADGFYTPYTGAAALQ